MEDAYKKRFQNKELPNDDFDAEGLWDDIADELDTGSSVSAFPWTYLGGAVLLLLVAAIGFVFLRNDVTEKKATGATLISENKKAEVAGEAEATLRKDSDKLTNDRQQIAAVEANVSSEIETDDLKDKSVVKNDLATAENEERDERSDNVSKGKNSVDGSAVGENEKRGSVSLEKADNKGLELVLENKDTDFFKSKTELTTDEKNSLTETINADEKQKVSSNKSAKKLTKKAAVSPLLFTSFTFLKSGNEIDLDSFAKAIPEPVKKEEKVKKIAFFGDLYGGANTLQTDFQLQTDSLSSEVENKTEAPLIGNAVGVNIGATYKGWQLHTGIALHTFNTRFDFAESTTRSAELSQILQKVYVDSTGAVQNQIFGDTTVVVTDTRRIEHYNRYRLLEIPLEIGRYRTQGKFMYGINAGIGFNFLTSQTGRTLDAEGEVLDFAKDTAPVLFRKFGISARIGGQFGYRLTEKVWLTAEPRAAWQSGLLFEENVRVQAVNFGVNAGVRMVF